MQAGKRLQASKRPETDANLPGAGETVTFSKNQISIFHFKIFIITRYYDKAMITLKFKLITK